MDAYTIEPRHDLPNSRILLMTLGADMNMPHQATIYAGGPAEWRESFRSTIQNILDNWEELKATFTEYFGSYFITRLTTESRLLITKESPSGDQRGQIDSLLQAFFREGKAAEEKLSSLVRDAFQLCVKLDYSGMSYLSLRVGASFDGIPDDPREARPLLEQYDKLDDQGDGDLLPEN